jgi:hypothetical protein
MEKRMVFDPMHTFIVTCFPLVFKATPTNNNLDNAANDYIFLSNAFIAFIRIKGAEQGMVCN